MIVSPNSCMLQLFLLATFRVGKADNRKRLSAKIQNMDTFLKAKSERLALPGPDKLHQILDVIEIVIIAGNSFPVIDDSVLFIPIQTIEQSIFTVLFRKKRKSVRFDFHKEALMAVFIARVTMANLFVDRAFPILAPALIGTLAGIASGT